MVALISVTAAVALVMVAAAIGFYGTIIGAGGGFILIPAFLILFDLEGVTAVGTGAVVLTAIGLAGSRNYLAAGILDRTSAVLMASASVPTAFVMSSVFASRIDSSAYAGALAVLLGVLAVWVAVMSVVGSDVPDDDQRELPPAGLLSVVGIGIGTISGLFAVGGGLLTLPAMIRLRGLNAHQAAATTAGAMTLSGVASVSGHALAGNINWTFAFWGLLGAVGGATAGSLVSARLNRRVILGLVAGGLAISALSIAIW